MDNTGEDLGSEEHDSPHLGRLWIQTKGAVMTDQEALRRWLWIAWRKGQQTEQLVKAVRRGMSINAAVAEYERPIYLMGQQQCPLCPSL